MDPYTSAPGSLLNRMVVPHSHLIRTAVQIQIHERKPFEPRFEPSAEVASSHHRLHRRHESPMPQLLAASFFLPQPSTILHFVLPMPHRTSTFDKGLFVWIYLLKSTRYHLSINHGTTKPQNYRTTQLPHSLAFVWYFFF